MHELVDFVGSLSCVVTVKQFLKIKSSKLKNFCSLFLKFKKICFSLCRFCKDDVYLPTDFFY